MQRPPDLPGLRPARTDTRYVMMVAAGCMMRTS